MKHCKSTSKATVVDFKRDASFFVERGLRSLHRYDYEKALKCLRRAVELEPNNAEYHCHLASVLAETGQFAASNDILYDIIEKWDPSMVEVYYYMANNYANMEDYQMAEEMAIRYLRESENGVYRADAEDLLDYIYFELNLPPRHDLPGDQEDVYVKHEQARRCLEEGRFLEALDILRTIVEAHPSFIPAWNNLSLAYYYVGDFDQAIATIEQTLEREPGNLHALCNLAVLLSHHNQTAQLVTLLSMLKKVEPFHQEHMYKLATTMGVLGQHEEAYRLYQRMLKSGPLLEACTYHYAAISAYMSNRISQAIRWWQKVKQLDPDSGIADYYLEMVKAEQQGQTKQLIPYQYHHPQRHVSLEKVNVNCVEDFKRDPMIRASLLWALQHGRDDVKQTVIQTLALIGDDESEAAIRHFYHQTTDPQLQKLALLALAEMGAELPTAAPSQSRPCGPTAEESAVEACLRRYLGDESQRERYDWCLQIWRRFRENSVDRLQTRKAEAWVAALEYLYGIGTKQKQTQAVLAQKYGISTTTIAKCIKALAALDFK